MAGYSGKIEKCEICGVEIAIEHKEIHMWGKHAKGLDSPAVHVEHDDGKTHDSFEAIRITALSFARTTKEEDGRKGFLEIAQRIEFMLSQLK